MSDLIKKIEKQLIESMRILNSGNLINPLTGTLSEARIDVIKQTLIDCRTTIEALTKPVSEQEGAQELHKALEALKVKTVEKVMAMCGFEELQEAENRVVKLFIFLQAKINQLTKPLDDAEVKKAREIVDQYLRNAKEQLSRNISNADNLYSRYDIQDAHIILSALESMEREIGRLKKEKLLVHITRPHSGEVWDYKLTPSELDSEGATIECGEYKIHITKEQLERLK